MKLKDLSLIAIFTALLAIFSWISIPFVVPFTLQTLGLFLSILILKTKKAFVSVILYLGIGLIGLPVFAGFNGGIGAIVGPTGGFLIGFLFVVLTHSVIIFFFKENTITNFVGLFLGLIVCYLFGTIFYLFIYAKETSFIAALTICVFPFVIPDIIKIVVAVIVSKRINSFNNQNNVVK